VLGQVTGTVGSSRGLTPVYPSYTSIHPFSVVYMNPFTAVGKKCMLLDACSILMVYKGVNTKGLALTQTAQNTKTTATPIFLSILTPPFNFTSVTHDRLYTFGFKSVGIIVQHMQTLKKTPLNEGEVKS
jgi:hypothetical protein